MQIHENTETQEVNTNLPETTKKRYQLSKGDPTTRSDIKRKFQRVAKDLVLDATLNPHIKKKTVKNMVPSKQTDEFFRHLLLSREQRW